MSSTRLDDGIFNVPDALGRSHLARRVAELATDVSRNPRDTRVLGVFGGWGAGKTHVLRLIGEAVATGTYQDQHLVALFPAWRYELEADLGAALISALGHVGSYPQLGQLGDPTRLSRLAENIAVAAATLLDFVALAGSSLGTLSVGPVAAPASGIAKWTADQLRDLANRDTLSGSRPYVDELSVLFARLVDQALGEREGRLVVLVDDLDRCSPSSMVRMFEWMKVYLHCPRCTFVVGLDHRAAAHAIEGRYRDYLPKSSIEIDNVAFGYRYLDKVFDDGFELGNTDEIVSLACAVSFGPMEPPPSSFSDAAMSLLGEDFPRRPKLDELALVPALLTARTLIRVARSYYDVLREYDRDRHRHSTSTNLVRYPRDAPFWLLLMLAMQHSMRPQDLDDFASGQGAIYSSALEGRLDSRLVETEAGTPRRQIAAFLAETTGGTGSADVPSRRQLALMAALVRQRVATKG